jgi:membrane protein DedA with SNARE-associated domain
MWRGLAPPFLVISGFVIIALGLNLFTSLTPDDILKSAVEKISEHGYWPVAAAAMIETVPGINLYTPGSGAILLAVASSRESQTLNPVLISLVATACFVATNVLNYAAGRYGWLLLFRLFRINKMLEQSTAKPNGITRWLALSCFHPNASSIASTICGLQRVRFQHFFVVLCIATLIWNAAWTLVAYLASPYMDVLLTTPAFLAVAIAWVLVIVFRIYRSNRRYQKE